MKTCSVCRIDKPHAEFSKRAASKDGYSPKCKDCAKSRDAAYYLRHQDKIKARTAAWAATHPDERQQEKARYRAKHREAINSKLVVWYAANRDKERARCARYHAENPHVALERGRRWATENKEAAAAKLIRRRARKLGAEGRHTGEDIQSIHAMQRGKCAACKCSLTGGYHVDHITALSKGGSNWPSNLQLLCGKCNRRKGAKAPEQFMRELGYLI